VNSQELRAELLRRELERRRAKADPLYLMSFMSAVDQRDGSRFDFEHLREPLEDGEVTHDGNRLIAKNKDWRWQRYVAEKALGVLRLICLKGRQIGVTWDLLAVDVAEALTMPGTASLLFRQREDEAIDNVRRWWTLYQSLPQHFKEGIRVLKPDRAVQPGRDGIALQFPSGAISEIIPMTSAAASGHGRSVRRVILDEAAYIEKLEEIRAAVEPAAGDAKICVISTANGVSNPETGEGNEFHRLWTAEETGYTRIFLPYDLHPERDQHWYDTAPEVQSLRSHQRHAQFPRYEHEAFALSTRVFFDPEDLEHYAGQVKPPLYRMDFVVPKPVARQMDGAAVANRTSSPRKLAVGPKSAKHIHSEGNWRIYREREEGHKYAIGGDCATGRGRDYSCAYVIDLTDGALCAEFHGKLDADLYAAQLHYMGRVYNTAFLAVDNVGIGEAVIVQLRHGREGRPPYPNMYRHIMSSRPSMDMAKVYGFPINVKTRPLILNQLEKWVRERTLPWVTSRLLFEMQTFVEHDKDPSPAAQEGSHDDAIFAAAISLEMYRLKGQHPEQKARRARNKKRKKPYKQRYPWLKAA